MLTLIPANLVPGEPSGVASADADAEGAGELDEGFVFHDDEGVLGKGEVAVARVVDDLELAHAEAHGAAGEVVGL